MKNLSVLICFLFSIISYGQSDSYSFKNVAERAVATYQMDKGQITQFHKIVVAKRDALIGLEKQSLSKNEKALEKNKINEDYNNSMMRILDTRQQRIFLANKNALNQLVPSSEIDPKKAKQSEQIKF